MGSLSIFHIIILLVVLAIILVPISKILQRAGWSGWWCVLCFVPMANIIMLWVFAFGDWPALPKK